MRTTLITDLTLSDMPSCRPRTRVLRPRLRRWAAVLAWVTMAQTAPAQVARTALTLVDACLGDTVTLSGSAYYVNFDWKPDQFGRRDGRKFSYVADRDRDIILSSEPPLGPNLISNNNFSDGLVGYTTDYTLVTPSTGQPGELAVLADLRDFDAAWRDCPDVTRDGGPDKMVVLRGDGDPASAITRNRVTFERDSFYVITFLATSTGVGDTPAGGELGVRVDGVTLAATLRLPSFNCSWRQFYTTFQAPRAGEYTVEIVDKSRRPGFGYAIDGTLTAKVEPTRIDTFRIRVVDSDTTFASTQDMCPGEAFVGQHFTARSDSTVCTRIRREGRCDSVFCESVTFLPEPEVTEATLAPRCSGSRDGSITIRVDGPGEEYSTRWADDPAAGSTRVGLAAGTYAATLTSPEGCTVEISVTLVDPPRLTWSEVGFAADDCPDTGPRSLALATLGGTGEVIYGFRQNELAVEREGLRAGSEVVISAKDSAGCQIDTTLAVPTPTNLPPLVIVVREDSTGSRLVDWTGGPPAFGVSTWRLGGEIVGSGRMLSLKPESSGVLQLTGEAASGCVWTAEAALAAPPQRDDYFPNAFSPNDDDINDAFWVVQRADVVAVERLEIYDRWGGLVFRRTGCVLDVNASATGAECAWRGRAEGTDARSDTGVYVYSARVRLSDNTVVTTSGEVHLLR